MELMSRSQENFIVMTVIYNVITDFTISDDKSVRDARELCAELCERPYEEVSPYIKNMVYQSLTNYSSIIQAFTPYLRNWKWERLPLLTQAILIMSYVHFYLVEKEDKRIIIDTAVELTKTYVEEKQGKFVNAILDKVLK